MVHEGRLGEVYGMEISRGGGFHEQEDVQSSGGCGGCCVPVKEEDEWE